VIETPKASGEKTDDPCRRMRIKVAVLNARRPGSKVLRML
jgi:hypothetical protein